jgi:superfamily I DNA and/or RNA helicase
VGRIELRGGQATIEVPEGWQGRLAKALDGQLYGDRRIRVRAEVPADARSAGEDHFQRLARLLDLESRAEAQQAAERGRRLSPAESERAGTSLVDLVIADEDTGLGGRHLLQLAKRNRAPLPWTRLGTGSPVMLSPALGGGHRGYRGVVYERTEKLVLVALGSISDELAEHETWRLDLSDDEVAMQRQKAALARARLARGDRLAELRDILLGQRSPQFDSERHEQALDPQLGSSRSRSRSRQDFGPNRQAFQTPASSATNRASNLELLKLNDTQRDAVQFALSARDVALIHGPPGTGKTTAVVELIRQAVREGRRVLACAPSNLAVDNIFERLLAARTRTVRLGHPARVLPQLRAHTLDLLVAKHPDVRLARKLVKQAMGLFRRAGRYTRARPAPGARREAREEARNLLADARRLENQAVEHILDTADVLCSTTTGLDSELLGTRRFDLAVIDEACQSVEPGCWIPLLRCERVVLAGDHCQLPPTVVSQEAMGEGLDVSLFERLMGLYGGTIARRLTVQYRMHQAIMDFSSLEFYEAELEADAAVSEHLLCDLPDVIATPLTQSPVEFIDTAGASFDEVIEPDGESRLNPQEAELVCRKVQQLLNAGVAAADVAVIAPYAAQVRLLREKLPVPGLEIDSVDGFQGREKEAVVISLVRSNPRGEIGFLGDVRRMNVAMTRARRKLLMVGDSATLSAHPFYRRAIEYFESLGAYRTVWEDDGTVSVVL